MAAKEQIHVVFYCGHRIKELYTQLGGMPLRVESKRFFQKTYDVFLCGRRRSISSNQRFAAFSGAFLYVSGDRWHNTWLCCQFDTHLYSVHSSEYNRLFALLVQACIHTENGTLFRFHKDCATMVVIPALITSDLDGMDILSKMEVYYAANQQENLFLHCYPTLKKIKMKSQRRMKR